MTRRLLTIALILFTASVTLSAQQEEEVPVDSIVTAIAGADSTVAMSDSITNTNPIIAKPDSIAKGPAREIPMLIDTTLHVKAPRDWSKWHPDPQRALWLALVIPGGGQIYNRKYWKLPLVYGGFIGCLYAMNWNNTMYKDYSQAYLDIMDDDPGTASYNQFLHLGMQITPANEERYKTIFKKRKDRYRRWRDMSFFVLCGVYALSVIDAYVDAELSNFDISKDLSLRVEPALFDSHQSKNPFQSSAVGLQCSLNF